MHGRVPVPVHAHAHGRLRRRGRAGARHLRRDVDDVREHEIVRGGWITNFFERSLRQENNSQTRSSTFPGERGKPSQAGMAALQKASQGEEFKHLSERREQRERKRSRDDGGE